MWTIVCLLKQGWGSEQCLSELRQRSVVLAAQPFCFQAESCWLGSRESAAGCQQPIRHCGCVRPGRATLPGAGHMCGPVCERACDTMSPRAAIELMRQQTSVSCQCHPEGDVSNYGCLFLCLFPITHSLVLTPPALPIFNHPHLT